MAARFGFHLSGVPVLVPGSATALFLPAAGVDPMPLAPPRLRGFTQRHGRAVPVFDASDAPPDRLPVRARRPVLVFDGLPEPAGLIVEAPPERLAEPLTSAPPAPPPPIVWRDALAGRLLDASGRPWWRVELTRLFDLLART